MRLLKSSTNTTVTSGQISSTLYHHCERICPHLFTILLEPWKSLCPKSRFGLSNLDNDKDFFKNKTRAKTRCRKSKCTTTVCVSLEEAGNVNLEFTRHIKVPVSSEDRDWLAQLEERLKYGVASDDQIVAEDFRHIRNTPSMPQFSITYTCGVQR
jgi:hypothetical protein